MTERDKRNLVGVLYAIDRYDIAIQTNAKVLRELVSDIDFRGDNHSHNKVINWSNNIVESIKLIRESSDAIHEVLSEIEVVEDKE